MRKFAGILLACFMLMAPVMAQAALVVNALGKVQGTPSSNQLVITTSGFDCPVGSLVVIFDAGGSGAPDNLSSLADSASNTYGAPFDSQSNSSAGVGLVWVDAVNTAHDLAIGSTITATYINSSIVHAFLADCVTGAATTSPLDISGKTANGGVTAATSATAVTSGTLSQANEVLFVGTVLDGNGGSFSGTSPWTKDESVASGGSPNATFCHQIVSATTSVSSANCNSWTNSVTWITDMVSFKAPSGVITRHNLSSMGVGN